MAEDLEQVPTMAARPRRGHQLLDAVQPMPSVDDAEPDNESVHGAEPDNEEEESAPPVSVAPWSARFRKDSPSRSISSFFAVEAQRMRSNLRPAHGPLTQLGVTPRTATVAVASKSWFSSRGAVSSSASALVSQPDGIPAGTAAAFFDAIDTDNAGVVSDAVLTEALVARGISEKNAELFVLTCPRPKRGVFGMRDFIEGTGTEVFEEVFAGASILPPGWVEVTATADTSEGDYSF